MSTDAVVLDEDDGVDVVDDLIDRALTTSWRRDGVCASYDGLGGDLWYPEGRATSTEYKQQAALAAKLCETCVVMDLCRAAALVNREEFGIWGSLGHRTRKNALKQGPDATRALLLDGVAHVASLRRGGASTVPGVERAA